MLITNRTIRSITLACILPFSRVCGYPNPSSFRIQSTDWTRCVSSSSRYAPRLHGAFRSLGSIVWPTRGQSYSLTKGMRHKPVYLFRWRATANDRPHCKMPSTWCSWLLRFFQAVSAHTCSEIQDPPPLATMLPSPSAPTPVLAKNTALIPSSHSACKLSSRPSTPNPC